jgi:hypothetical protein
VTEWITRLRAAEILGVSTNTVDRLVTIGELTPRPDLQGTETPESANVNRPDW